MTFNKTITLIKKYWLLVLLVALLIPFVINWSYNSDSWLYNFVIRKPYYDEGTVVYDFGISKNPFVTVWEGKDVLQFYGGFLAFLGTVFLGIIAIEQNKNIISMEERKLIPSLKLSEKGQTMGFSNDEINVQLFLENESGFPIKLQSISNLRIEHKNVEIPLSKWIEGYTILNRDSLLIDFMQSKLEGTIVSDSVFSDVIKVPYLKGSFEVSMIIPHVSSKPYIQKFIFGFGLIDKDTLRLDQIEYDYEMQIKEDNQ